MKMHHRNGFAVLLMAALLAASLSGCASLGISTPAASADANALQASGMIEARPVNLASELGGKVLEVNAAQGQQVQQGDVLIKLEDAGLQAQMQQARAAEDTARAQLALLQSGATDEQLRAAQAGLAQAEASLRLARASLQDATASTRPEQVNAALGALNRVRRKYQSLQASFSSDQADALLEALNIAQGSLDRARARRELLGKQPNITQLALEAADAAIQDTQEAQAAAQAAYDALQDANMPYFQQLEKARMSLETAKTNQSLAQARYDGLNKEKNINPEAVDSAKSALDDAGKLADAAQTALDQLDQGASALALDAAWKDVQAAQEQVARITGSGAQASLVSVETLSAQVDAAQAARDAVQANLDQLKSGARPQEIEAARANLAQASAVVAALQLQLDKAQLTAPIDGWVISRSIEPGEIATPGATLLQIADLSQLRLSVYIPETEIAQVSLGESAQISIDAFPDRQFPGQVTYIAPQAEFTPENVQTKAQRVNLVFKVVITLDNPDQALKPGLPADVTFMP